MVKHILYYLLNFVYMEEVYTTAWNCYVMVPLVKRRGVQKRIFILKNFKPGEDFRPHIPHCACFITTLYPPPQLIKITQFIFLDKTKLSKQHNVIHFSAVIIFWRHYLFVFWISQSTVHAAPALTLDFFCFVTLAY